MLEARKLSASRGDANLFTGLDFELKGGSLLRVGGANGSGKTSLLRALCGLLLPSAGEVRWNGENVRSLREEYWKLLAYIGHADGLKDDLTVEENLAFACALSGLQISAGRARAALEKLGLAGRERLPARVLSQGQRRRTALARLVVAESQPLWVLDEPFAALDAAAVEQVQSVASEHLARGGIVVLTTHQDARIEARSVVDLRLGR
ncbi:MAG TPA: cytochrome c biogenesis heme-transporting ATPase CcmA [Burkholderiales bacterium]|nr:cytochrome c biogenesis heme-transporting ATPase CcmA [Burkholderiales bacterium]